MISKPYRELDKRKHAEKIVVENSVSAPNTTH